MRSHLQTLFREKKVKTAPLVARLLGVKTSTHRGPLTRRTYRGERKRSKFLLTHGTYFGFVMAPSEAERTRAPYFAKTPVVKRGLGAFH